MGRDNEGGDIHALILRSRPIGSAPTEERFKRQSTDPCISIVDRAIKDIGAIRNEGVVDPHLQDTVLLSSFVELHPFFNRVPCFAFEFVPRRTQIRLLLDRNKTAAFHLFRRTKWLARFSFVENVGIGLKVKCTGGGNAAN
jgi:hypothetical protein